MQKLINSVQNYAWGSKTALTELYGVANPEGLPMAELWMGAHPKSSSKIQDDQGQTRALREVIDADKTALLGAPVAERFGELPFLFKVLCADQPLSIQVHPNKQASEEGFARENAAGIPLDAAERNYKDPNHKPELVFALTPFLAMNAFREFSEIVSLLQPVAGAHTAIAHFLAEPNADRLRDLFAGLLNMQGEEKSRALAVLKATVASQQGEPWDTIRFIAQFYPDDSGLFSPLLLNVVKLNPGEAMFLFAETPHAYLQGVALEVMANSDNVLRAGLTPKYIDIPELVANVKFVAKPAAQLLTQPEKDGAALEFPIPVEDFAFSLHDLQSQPQRLAQESAAILFCVEGEAVLSKGDERLTLKPGESAFVAANESPVNVSGVGRLARVYNKLN
ncbi:mannose-6-phosphate isomerase [Cronobacter turicensis]|jgi:mannose-6-phosphate isomerase|uniref:Mannose-6-phosphate isomerase n=1 Tax=Cronobacter turicensis (strain DSM 18703 / CCUG 55852 / LMG 23827 / z3032) TaxID=693216 RepID=C9Y3P7_CROTZ|nr:mannose-6-phosphate isomerase [Cronobacter turicensis]CBA30645.1 Mannose-6-phosphate isomerase [Cronobacter turicensis z3032]EKM0376911.1 mannose-6-phosphate isomerase [Cronobacter turicensis]EKY3195818.1 mannose-6-phosphate isomerase [Cronobacter turicensis]ELY4129575.1 mannose-6-phosphate isomerase [Cronobacter turicensis]ELY4349214.1 mannose-6-phosphate isomerase [Cronobacter turicensis]